MSGSITIDKAIKILNTAKRKSLFGGDTVLHVCLTDSEIDYLYVTNIRLELSVEGALICVDAELPSGTYRVGSQVKLTKPQQAALNFAKKYPDQWHSYCYRSQKPIGRLWELGLVEVNEFKQYRFLTNQE